jgi:thiamine pyrophosphate-dependent acetolactate synthase large subunit-like protein
MRYALTDTPDGLEAAINEAFRADEPAFIEVRAGAFPNPFPHMFFRRVRGPR